MILRRKEVGNPVDIHSNKVPLTIDLHFLPKIVCMVNLAISAFLDPFSLLFLDALASLKPIVSLTD